jgi:hypothetical protein
MVESVIGLITLKFFSHFHNINVTLQTSTRLLYRKFELGCLGHSCLVFRSSDLLQLGNLSMLEILMLRLF